MPGRKKSKNIAKKLELSEVKYRELFDSINVCVIVLKPKDGGEDFIIKDMNAALEKVERVRLGEFIGKSLSEALPVAVELGTVDTFNRVWRTGEPERFPAIEFKAMRVKCWREGYIYRLPSGDIVAVYEDVTARIKAEDALRKAELRYRTVADFTYDLEYWKGPDKKLVYISPSCEHITGYSVQEFMKDPGLLDRIVLEEDRERWLSHEDSSGPFIVNEISFRIRRRDGEIRWIEHRCKPVIDENNRFLGLRGSDRDITDRKRIERQLSDSEERFRTLFLAAPIGLSMADRNGRFIAVNDAFQKMLGFTRDELLNKTVIELTHPHEKDLFSSRHGAMVRGERPGYNVEKRFIKKDGSTLWTNVTTMRIVAADGTFLHSIGIVEDITERKKVAEALKESEARYRSLIETTGAGFASVDLEGNIILVNESLCEITGYTRDEILGRPFTDFVHPEDLPLAMNEFSNAVSEGQTKNIFYEMRILGKNRVIWMRFNPTEWIVEGSTLGINAAMFDISDRKQVEEALHHSEEIFRLLAENAVDVIWLADPQLKLTYISPSIRQLRGYTPEEAVLQTLADIMPPGSMRKILDEYELHKADIERGVDVTVYVEVEQYRKDGATVWVETAIRTVYNDDRKLTGFIGVSRDVSERKRAEEALKWDVIWFADPRLKLIYISPSIRKLIGYTPEEAMSQTLADIMTPKSLQIVLDKYERQKAAAKYDSDAIVYIEAEHYRKDGSTVWVETAVRAVYNDNRKHTGFIGVSRDISQRKRAQNPEIEKPDYP